YVTLSDCWGGTVSHQLTRDNYSEFTRGIPVRDLPRTFQDAVYVAASMEQVGYLWIDSLCIIQYDEQDWLVQSATMDRVYSETYLNLSATASFNSHGGLFRHGDFKLLEEEDVLLNIEGLPLAYDRKDATFWEQEVDRGPVNSRGWVLQERLMSPRVLYFCHDQVGWECACQR
ncbi:heterokaryon incompatibility, partial [Lizonia empirigonia]